MNAFESSGSRDVRPPPAQGDPQLAGRESRCLSPEARVERRVNLRIAVRREEN